MKLAFSIARRFLKSGKAQTFLIILGIAVGVSVQVFIGSLISGLQKDLVNTTIGSSSHITITSSTENGYLLNYDQLMDDIYATSADITIVSPTISTNGYIFIQEEAAPISLRGFLFVEANQIYKFDDEEILIQGRLPQITGEIAVGSAFFAESGFALNDTITLVLPANGNFQATIVGVFDYGVRTINERWVITTLSALQSYTNHPGAVASIEMQIGDVFAAETLNTLLSQTLGSEYSIDDWMKQNASLLSGLQGQSISSLMIQVFVMISVVLGIASVLAITVTQKSKQLGILKAMGITDADASLVFLFQGVMLGIGGAILGVLLGLGLAYSFTTFALGEDGNPVVPLFIDGNFIALSAMIAIAAAMVASLIPAGKSRRLTVIEVIRNA